MSIYTRYTFIYKSSNLLIYYTLQPRNAKMNYNFYHNKEYSPYFSAKIIYSNVFLVILDPFKWWFSVRWSNWKSS